MGAYYCFHDGKEHLEDQVEVIVNGLEAEELAETLGGERIEPSIVIDAHVKVIKEGYLKGTFNGEFSIPLEKGEELTFKDAAVRVKNLFSVNCNSFLK